MAPVASQKRKVDYHPPGTVAQARKRQKGKDARAIPTQTADAALSTAGELNITSFVKAREFEIAALDSSMKKARKSLTQRAFQQVPRHMRRRTASHNVKKIPRRLRGRAAREMKEDNTPTGSARKRNPSTKLRLRLETAKKLHRLNVNRKIIRQKKQEAKQNAKEPDPTNHVSIARVPRIKKNTLAEPPQATSKFKRRQVNKTWLPTHLWHTKRARMTRPTLPLWRMAIPLRPTEKTYRSVHRASGSRGCVAWDASYISTIGCQGTEAALEGMLKALAFTGEGWSGARYNRWKAGTRFAQGWTFERDNDKRPTVPVTIIWQVKEDDTIRDSVQTGEMDVDCDPPVDSGKTRRKVRLDRRLFIRLHPSAFHQFWLELLKVAKLQKPQVLLEDLRFEIGSIDLQGPGSSEALVAVLKLADDHAHFQKVWQPLSALGNAATLPQNAMLAFSTIDPRLNHPPRQLSVERDDQSMNRLNEVIVAWEPDKNTSSSALFEHKERYRISKSLPAQKAINRRRAGVLPGQQLELSDKDPKIPVILLAHRPAIPESGSQGTWTVLLPWCCVDLVWRSLMYYPLTSGSTPSFGGLEQTQQLAFEASVPWYPADFPGTEAGKAWDRTESKTRYDKWIRRPTSKRFAWDALDLGLGRKGELGCGWTCDWEYLFQASGSTVNHKPVSGPAGNENNAKSSQRRLLLTQKQRKAASAAAEQEKEAQARRRNTSSPETDDNLDQLQNNVKYIQLAPAQATSFLNDPQHTVLPARHALATVRVRLLTKGTPKPAARIYRLPPKTAAERSNIPPQIGTQPQKDLSTSAQPMGEVAAFTPSLFAEASAAASHSTDTSALRQRWLSVDPNPTQPNPHSPANLPRPSKKEHRNHHNDPSTHRAYDSTYTTDLSRIRVFPPKDHRPQVRNMFGPNPPPLTASERLKMLQPQLIPKMIVNGSGELVEEGLWDRHIPCPEAGDLIGFVTSGGYNLAEGRGTAIGGVWVQRVVGGWREEEGVVSVSEACGGAKGESGEGHPMNVVTNKNASKRATKEKAKLKLTKAEAQEAKEEKRRRQEVERERHLCIVRNAGESIGRLGIWELC